MAVEILSDGALEDDTLELGSADAPQLDDDGNPIVAPEPLDEAFPDTFDEEGEVRNPHLVAQLRTASDEKSRRIRELEHRLAQPKIVRTPKPTIESCDYDDDTYDAKKAAWDANEAAADAQEHAPAPAQNDQAKAWQTDLAAYKASAAKLGDTFKVAEDTVIGSLSEAQQSTIVMAAKNPAQFINALGRSPNRLAALSLITNPIKLAAEVARIEGAKTMPRREPANIDTPLRGSGQLSDGDGSVKRASMVDKAAKDGGDTTALLNQMRAKRAAKA